MIKRVWVFDRNKTDPDRWAGGGYIYTAYDHKGDMLRCNDIIGSDGEEMGQYIHRDVVLNCLDELLVMMINGVQGDTFPTNDEILDRELGGDDGTN